MNDIIEKVYYENNNNLLSQNIVNTHYSGSTCVSVIYTPEKLITINVGDCRAVLGRYINGSNNLI